MTSSATRSRPRGFWSSLTKTEQVAFAALARHRSFNAGTVLCHEGAIANDVMVIQSGWTKVCVDASGRERILAVRGAGDLLGERAVLRVRSRSATVIALDSVSVFLMAADDFGDFVDEHPRVLAVLERQVYDRLTEERQPPDEPIDVEQQLASVILDLVRRQGGDTALTLPISHRDLAGWTRLPDKTVTRILASWHAQGLVLASRQRIIVIDVDGLERICGESAGRPEPMPAQPRWSGQNCSIMFADVTAFGDQQRDDVDRLTVRRRMYEIVRSGFDASGVPWTACHHEDRGDGVLVVVPPAVPPASLVDPLVAKVAAALRRHNHQAGDAVRIQLRLALHVGPVVSDTEGVSGSSIIQTARMLDSPVLKEQVNLTGADLGFIVSAFVYDTVVKHGPGYVDPAGFQRINFRAKESEITAWMYLAGSTQAVPARRAAGPGAPQPGFTINGSVNIIGGNFVVGSDNEFTR